MQTTVHPVSTVLLTAHITIAAALASRPDVGSSMKIKDGLATNSTAIVSLFLCSVDRPSTPGRPTRAFQLLDHLLSSILTLVVGVYML